MSRAISWYAHKERGSTLGIRFTVWFYRRLGAGIARLLIYPIVSYFFLTDAASRRASRRFLARVHACPEGARTLGGVPGIKSVFRHHLEFGFSILDRAGFWMRDASDFEIRIHGNEHLKRIVDEKRGALVLGSHLGSFDVMRVAADTASPIRINVLMFTRHAARINAIFDQLSANQPGNQAKVRVIPIEHGSIQHVLDARSCIRNGEVVAILADRVPPGESHRVSIAKFLGESARFPTGPIFFAEQLGCPVLFMTGLRADTGGYEIHVEPFADPIKIPSAERYAAVERYCQAYADLLASYCTRAPYQWFNFFDFWAGGESGVAN
jgi:predicted LPLAT superfamily acyltransferase